MPGAAHPCPEPGCGKVFSSSSHMRRHVRNHRGDTRFACRHCGQSFVRREVWKRHEQLHLNPQSSKPRIKPVRGAALPPDNSAGQQQQQQQHPQHQQHRQQQQAPQHPTHHHHHSSLSAPHPPSGNPSGGSGPPSHASSDVSTPLINSLTGGDSSISAVHHYTLPTSHPGPGPPSASTDTHSGFGTLPSLAELPVQSFVDVPQQNNNASPYSQTLLPGLGIEGWLDQILSAQAGFTPIQPPAPTPLDSLSLAPVDAGRRAPSAADATACGRLSDWVTDSCGPMHPPLTLDRFTRSIAAYWDHVDCQYPILHRATFQLREAPSLVLLAMVLLGSALAGGPSGPGRIDSEDAHWVEEMFPIARAMAARGTPRTAAERLGMLQGLMLLSIVGHGMSSDDQDHGQALVSAALTFARRASLFEDRSRTSKPVRGGDLEEQWIEWVSEESTRRVCWLILMRDTEYATFFYQLPSRATTPFRLPVDLPCTESAWDAPSAGVWARQLRAGETLAVALKRCLLGGGAPPPPRDVDKGFAHLVLSYGLCALGWDLNRRDLVAPEISKTGPGPLNAFLLRTFSANASEPTTARTVKLSVLESCNRDISLICAIDLHLETLHLHVFVGETSFAFLQPVRPTDWIDASKAMRRWANEPGSAGGVGLAAGYLRDAIRMGNVPTLNRAWAIYTAFLVCWAYYVIMRRNTHEAGSSIPTQEDALRCCTAMDTWAHRREYDDDRDDSEPPPALMRALSTQVVFLLGTRHEVMIQNACALVDRNAVP